MIRRDDNYGVFQIFAEILNLVVYQSDLLCYSFVRSAKVVHIVVGLMPIRIDILISLFLAQFLYDLAGRMHAVRLDFGMF